MTKQNSIQPEQLLNQLNWRYATKQFDPQRKIDASDFAALSEALLLTPSSYGLQPWKFIVVADPVKREQLVGSSWGQRQVADASHLVVFAIKKELSEGDVQNYVDRTAVVRGVSSDSLSGFRDMMVGSIIKGMDSAARREWATRQVYIALGNFLNSAALLGIDACPMEGIQREKYDEILGLNVRGLTTIVVAAAGYRAATDKYAGLPKVRFAKEDVLVEV